MEVVKSKELEKTILKDQKKAIEKINRLRSKITYYEKRAKILTILTRFFIVVGLMFLTLDLWTLCLVCITPYYEVHGLHWNILLFFFLAIVFLMPVEFLRAIKDKVEDVISVIEEEI